MHNVEVIAHRGASAYAPENTVPAFVLGAELATPAAHRVQWLERRPPRFRPLQVSDRGLRFGLDLLDALEHVQRASPDADP